jgi:hypothetical protein
MLVAATTVASAMQHKMFVVAIIAAMATLQTAATPTLVVPIKQKAVAK